MTERTLTMATETSINPEATSGTAPVGDVEGAELTARTPRAVIPAPRTPGDRLVTVSPTATLGRSTPVADVDARPGAADVPTGSTWVERPIRHRIRAILRPRSLTPAEQLARARAAAAGQPLRTDALAAQARLFTGLR